jgi:serine/threonine protein kinase/S1-C subfamily serine protease
MAQAPSVPDSVSTWQRAVLAVKKLSTDSVEGSCFVIDASRGLLWTCSHVVGESVGQKWQIGMAAAPRQPIAWMYEARVVYSTPKQPGLDGALLRITALTSGVVPLPVPLMHTDGKPLPALPLGDDAALRLPGDEPAILLGYPSITQVMTPTVGIYSNLKDYAAKGGMFLLTDSTMLPGHSGGPGLNQRGEVVGWNIRHALKTAGLPATAALPGGAAIQVACGINELRPVSALLAELQGPAATALMGPGASAPADVRAHLASQPGCIAAGTHLFGPAAAAAFAVAARAHADAAAVSEKAAQDAAAEASTAATTAQAAAADASTAQAAAQGAQAAVHGAVHAAAGHVEAAGRFAGQASTAATYAKAAAEIAVQPVQQDMANEQLHQLMAVEHNLQRTELEAHQLRQQRDLRVQALASRGYTLELTERGHGQNATHLPWLHRPPVAQLQLAQLQASQPMPAVSTSPPTSRGSSPSRSNADFGLVIDGDHPRFDVEAFKVRLAMLLRNEVTPTDISISHEKGRRHRSALVTTGSCEVAVNLVVFGSGIGRSGSDHSADEELDAEEEGIEFILKGLISKEWPSGVDVTKITVKVNRRGSIILVLELPQPLPVLLLQLVAQRCPKLLEALPGRLLCCQLGGSVERLEGCEERHVEKLAAWMEQAKRMIVSSEEATRGEPSDAASEACTICGRQNSTCSYGDVKGFEPSIGAIVFAENHFAALGLSVDQVGSEDFALQVKSALRRRILVVHPDKQRKFLTDLEDELVAKQELTPGQQEPAPQSGGAKLLQAEAAPVLPIGNSGASEAAAQSPTVAATVSEPLTPKPPPADWTQAGSTEAARRLTAAKETLLDHAACAAHVDDIRSGSVRRGDWECDAREALKEEDRRKEQVQKGLWCVVPSAALRWERELGRGFYGVVYEVVHGGVRLACKKMSLTVVDERACVEGLLKREVRALQQVQHPHLVRLHGVVTDDPLSVSLLMELSPVGSLRTLLDDRPNEVLQSEAAQLALLTGIALGMAHLHGQQPSPILHHNLRSANVLVWPDAASTRFVAKVSDFGLATGSHEQIMRTGRDTTATLAYKAPTARLAYKAPEAFDDEFTAASEVYAFAIVAWEVLTAKVPWEGYSLTKLMKAIINEERPPLPQQGDFQLVKRCWAQEAKDRPTFAALAQDLQAVVATAVPAKAREVPEGWTGAVDSLSSNPCLAKALDEVRQGCTTLDLDHPIIGAPSSPAASPQPTRACKGACGAPPERSRHALASHSA